MLSFRRRAGAVVVVACLLVAACGSDEQGSDEPALAPVSIHDPWSRQPATGQDRSAVYGVVTNNSDSAITAVGASNNVSSRVELHQTTMNEDGQMSMTEREGGFTIAAGESLAFEPGGPHIMSFDVDAAGYPEAVEVTLVFDDGSSLDFIAEVRAIGDELADDIDDIDMDMDMGG